MVLGSSVPCSWYSIGEAVGVDDSWDGSCDRSEIDELGVCAIFDSPDAAQCGVHGDKLEVRMSSAQQ